MSLKDSRILFAAYFQDFSVTALTTSYVAVITNLPANCKGIFLENTSGKQVSLAMGPAGFEHEVDRFPIGSTPIEKSLILSKGTNISVKTLESGSVSSGKIQILIYA